MQQKTVLERQITALIRQKGPIPIEDFMQIVLHDPVHGYYRQGVPVGRDGDFSTAPEHSQLFGEMVAVWAFEQWQRLGKPEAFILLELGPGRGTMMRSLLSATTAQQQWHDAIRLYLLESNATLRQLQQEQLAPFAPTYWQEEQDLPDLPLIVVANEFFDTFPMQQFLWTMEGWRPRLVTVKRGRLALCLGDVVDLPITPPVDTAKSWFYEGSPRTLALVQRLGAHIHKHGGSGLLIDYGYERSAGEDTLFALRQQKHTDILYRPGETDVTGDVDFGALRRVLTQQGLTVAPLVTQGDFFQSCGIRLRTDQIKQHSPAFAQEIEEECRKLTDPAIMGSWFKAFTFSEPTSTRRV